MPQCQTQHTKTGTIQIFEKSFIYLTWVCVFFFLPPVGKKKNQSISPPWESALTPTSCLRSVCGWGWWAPSTLHAGQSGERLLLLSCSLLSSLFTVSFLSLGKPPQNLFKVLHHRQHTTPNPFTDCAPLFVPTSQMKYSARSPHPAFLKAPKKSFSPLSSSLDRKVRVYCENRYYFKQPVTRVVSMAYQPCQATLQLLFYGLKLEVLMHPRKATGRNHTRRLKMW